MDELSHPRIFNTDVSTQLIGLAFDLDQRLVYYCSTAGAGVSVKAIFSSLASNTAKSIGCSKLRLSGATGANPITQWSAQLPDTQIQHSIICYREHDLLMVSDPSGAPLIDTDDPNIDDQRRELLGQHMPTMHQQLGLFLNQQTDVPVHETWYDTLWDFGLDDDAITPLSTYGDCLGAWIVNPKYEWLELTQTLLESGKLSWPSNNEN